MAIIKKRFQDTTDVETDEIKNPTLDILHMYPREMNIYGDYGNVIVLKKRIAWRAIESNVYQLHLNGKFTDEKGDVVDKKIEDFDIYFMGGGQDNDQGDVFKDLLKYKTEIEKLVENNRVFLLICGGYQLFGKHFLTADHKNIEGLGILDVDTVGGKDRCIGNIIVDSTLPDLKEIKLVGFENHSGRTKILSNKVKTFGKILYGVGNSEKGGEEGGYYKNVFGCYIHGSLLPKNPEFADMLIRKALEVKYGENKMKLVEIDDYTEKYAREKMLKKYLND